MKMKKISKNRAGFSKRMLSILLVIVLFVGSLSVGSVAEGAGVDDETGTASATEDAGTMTEEPSDGTAQESEVGAADSSTDTPDSADSTTNPEESSKEESENPENPSGEESENPENPSKEESENPENPSKEESEDPENPSGEESENPENPSKEESENPENPSGEESEDPENPSGEESENPENPSEKESEELQDELELDLTDELLEEIAEKESETEDTSSNDSANIDFNQYEDRNLDIYNSSYYSLANGDVIEASSGYGIAGENEENGIIIGNHPLDGNADTQSKEEDISVSLNGLKMGNTMTIKPVGSENEDDVCGNRVVLTVNGESSLGELVADNGANLGLILNENLTVDGDIALGENSRIEISGDGSLTVNGTFRSKGAVALNGGTIEAKGISAVDLSLDETTVKAKDNAITATGTLSMKNSKVENASLFGYASGSGEKTLTLRGSNTFSNVTAVGCNAGSSFRVFIEGIDTVTGSGTTYYCDYSISYEIDDSIKQEDNWPVAYRVSSDTASFDDATICGYHTKSGYIGGKSTILLPEISKTGYEYKGWWLKESDELVKEITSAKGNITLCSKLTAGNITVKLDSGYDSEQYANDEDADEKLPERITIISCNEGDEISLPVPYRPDYVFEGWRVTSGTAQETITAEDKDETVIPYTVTLDDCVMEETGNTEKTRNTRKTRNIGETLNTGENGNTEETSDTEETGDTEDAEKAEYVITMEAVWSSTDPVLILCLGDDVKEKDNLLISVDGGTTYLSFSDLNKYASDENEIGIEERNIKFSSNDSSADEQTISEYLCTFFDRMPKGDLPILKDSSQNETTQAFVGWYTDKACTSGKEVAADTKVKDLDGDKTLYAKWMPNIYQTLKADSSPEEDTTPSSVSYPLPDSMKEGKLSYEITENSNSLNLVTKDEMTEHQYDSTWTTGEGENKKSYAADNTVAIELTLKKGGEIHNVDLQAGGEKELKNDKGMNLNIGGGWDLTLTLYHSKVMTDNNNKSYTFTIEYTFEDSSGKSIEDQWLKETVTVELTPSLYKVEYRVNLPDDDDLSITENEFDKKEDENGNVYYSMVKEQKYGLDLLATKDTLMLEGYDRDAKWSYDYKVEKEEKTASLTKLALDAVFTMGNGFSSDEAAREAKKEKLKDGKITVYVGYTAKRYTLEKDGTVLDDAWIITYGDGANDNGPTTTLNGISHNVKYHSLVTFTPNFSTILPLVLTFKDGDNVEKKWLEKYDIKRKDDGSFTFVMPAKDVTISSVWDLYLDNGTIELFPDGFRQTNKYGSDQIPWPGDYRIWQDESNSGNKTSNVLRLYGNLTKRNDTEVDRNIVLGHLNITSANSIELVSNTGNGNANVVLTQQGNIKAKNILVPEGTSLTVKGDYNPDKETPTNQGDEANEGNKITLTLTPGTKHAAIGAAAPTGGENAGESADGSITLENVNVSMTLDASSDSSGIGFWQQNGTGSNPCGKVTVTDSKITVEETGSNESGNVTHAWIGGAGVKSVNITNTTLLGKGIDRNRTNAVDGKEVILTKCTIGTKESRVNARIHAAGKLKIKSCKIYQ